MYQAYKKELERLDQAKQPTLIRTSIMASASTKLKLAVFLPSTRDGRNATRVRKFIEAQLKGKYEVTVLDPAEIDLPLLTNPIHFYPDRSQVPKGLLDIEAAVKTADAFLVVTAEYNRSIPPALSNLLDYLPPALFACKPSGIISYSMGPFAGLFAATQLRCLLAELGSLSMPMIMPIPLVHTALDENGKASNSHLEPGLATLMKQLDWYAVALKTHRDKVGVFSRNPGE